MRGSRAGRLVALLALWLATLAVLPFLGAGEISWGDVVADAQGTAALVVLKIRLPRVLLGLLAGGALAVAGAALQTLFRNPLAEPYTLGVASGAALGAVLALQLETYVEALGLGGVGLAAFAGAAAVTVLLLGLASSRFGSDRSALLLAGVAVSLSASALILFLQVLADWTKTFRMVRWMMGGLAVVGYGEVLWLAPWALACALALWGRRWELDLLLAGEETAAGRGVDLRRLRILVLTATSLAVGATVAVAGPIGFVGLIVPHALRRLVGSRHAALLGASFLGGGIFLALCDYGARRVMAPAELPVGVVTALLGGPAFLWILLRRRP